MDYNLLTNPLPESFKVNNNSYDIYSETERAIDCLARLEDKTIDPQAMEGYLISRLLTQPAQRRLNSHQEDKAEVIAKLLAFLGSAPTPSYEPSGLPHSKEPMVYWALDSPAIVASFRQAYGISLLELKNLHYWEFSALLYGLPGDTRMGSLMQTRMMVIDAKESAEQKKTHEAQKRSAKPKDTRPREVKEQEAINNLASFL